MSGCPRCFNLGEPCSRHTPQDDRDRTSEPDLDAMADEQADRYERWLHGE